MDVGRLWATLIDRMQGDDRRRLSWSVRHDRANELDQELLEELIGVCRDACAREFSSTDGYVTAVRRLSGALDGANITIARGRSGRGGDEFSALISIQRYARTQEASTAEVRVVASCRHPRADGAHAESTAALSRWGMTGCALGTMGAGAAGLELSGVLATWGQVLLLLPALMAWRIYMALRISTSLRNQRRARLVKGNDPARDGARASDLHRWQRVTDLLLAQRETMGQRATMRPFRSQGGQPGNLHRERPTALPPAVLPVPALPT
jgi:hypothetical protein